MKGVYIFIACVLFSNLKAQSLQSFGLKGNVKSIKESCNDCSANNMNTEQCFFHEINYFFTNQGKYIKPKLKELGYEYLKEKQSTTNGFAISTFKKVDDDIFKHYDQYYDNDDLLIKTVYYDKEGKVKDEYNCFYTKNNLREKVIRVSDENGLNKTIISYWDEYGSACGDETYYAGKLLEKRVFDIKYKFDEFGNWTYKYVSNGTHTLIHNRVITYY